jgi:glutamate/aspartate transport system permease protein
MADFDWSVILRNAGFLGHGLALSALLVAVASTGGLLLGTALALLRMAVPRGLGAIVTGYVAVLRSVPLILVLFWFYFLLPVALGHPVSALGSAFTAFVLFEAAFYCEIVRAGIAGVPQGQRLAAMATGLRGWQALRLVILPQAARAMVPVLLNQVILVFQDTSLVYVVSLRDFLTTANIVATRDGRPLEMYSTVAGTYLVLCLGGTLLIRLRPSWKPAARSSPA